MSNSPLPPEILDHIVDDLRDKPKALQDCCLVAKSWIPRTRKHLFANIEFSSPEKLKSWKKAFPDSSSSPASYTRTLSVKFPQAVTAADAEEGGWIQTFSRVVHLDLDTNATRPNDSEVSLAPFHGFSPVLKSLCIFSTLLPHSQIFGFVHSLPLLEDLSLTVLGMANDGDLDVCGPPAVIPPPSSPPFTGTLWLFLLQGMKPAARRLLDLPNGLRFRRLTMLCLQEDDHKWINALVAGCSDTLESLKVTCRLYGAIVWLLRRNRYLNSISR